MENDRLTRGAIRFGAFEVDLRAGELRKQGVKIKLQEQPFQILAMLLEHPDQVVTREELRSKLWPADTFVDFEHSVNKAVSKLREALGDSAEMPRYVETLPKHGYRFLAPVEVVDGDNSAAISKPKEKGTIRWRRYGSAFAGAVILIAAAGAFGGVSIEKLWNRLQAKPAFPSIHSLAVLPFQNLSNDPDEEYFTDGMTEELIIKLSKIKALRVISRTSVMAYKGNRKPLREIAKELRIDAVVEGTVQRSGDQVRITARLVHVPEEKNLWAQSYEREMRDVLVMQSQIAQEIAGSVHAEISPEEREAISSNAAVDPRAYDAYLKGDQHWAKFTDEDWRKSKQYFEEAIQIDPKYARAYSALAGVQLGLSWGKHPPDLKQIQTLAEKALELDPTLDDPHIVLGWVHLREWRLPESEKEFAHAAEIAPNNPHGQISYYNVLLINHKLSRPTPDFLHLKQGNPTSPDVLSAFGVFLVLAGEYERAAETCRDALSMQADFPFAHYCLGRALLGEEKPELAIAELELAAERGGHTPYFQSYLAQAHAVAGRRQEALKILQSLETGGEPSKRFQIALIYSQLGDKKKALASLEKSYANRDWDLVFMGVEPSLATLRSEPRFQKLAQRVGVAQQ